MMEEKSYFTRARITRNGIKIFLTPTQLQHCGYPQRRCTFVKRCVKCREDHPSRTCQLAANKATVESGEIQPATEEVVSAPTSKAESDEKGQKFV